uniref:uncharacterized protein LOC120833065 isoform X2 n=1 Tax=Gasterosteus aculeatus aculeatus TaxID=481459 RepID=UPI001A98F839|nr:uncharacterized protein LOC120833065 isoform X2 [Gasterosteus aculeatus aculeatus]
MLKVSNRKSQVGYFNVSSVVGMIKMSIVGLDQLPRVSKTWIALRRLDKNDDRVVALREVSIPPAAEVNKVIQIITTTFGLNSSDVTFKLRNNRGCLIPLNSSIPANSKHMPLVLEVAKIYQHVRPEPRSVPMTVINKSMKTRLQTIDRRVGLPTVHSAVIKYSAMSPLKRPLSSFLSILMCLQVSMRRLSNAPKLSQ